MQVIRTLQYAILAFAFAIVGLYVALTGTADLFFNRILSFNRTESYWEIISAEPLLPTVLAVTFCLCLGLEAVRTRLQSHNSQA